MPTFNTLAPVVELIDAETAEGAVELLHARLRAAGFDVTYAVESKSSDAMLSEDQSGHLPPYINWQAGKDWYRY
jgi:hypothetical protein